MRKPWWTLVWWRSQSRAPFSTEVSPPSSQCSTWWASHHQVGAWQPANERTTPPPTTRKLAAGPCGAAELPAQVGGLPVRPERDASDAAVAGQHPRPGGGDLCPG